jgi:hypothetical protein
MKVFTGGLFLNLENGNGSPSVMSMGIHDTIQGSSRVGHAFFNRA